MWELIVWGDVWEPIFEHGLKRMGFQEAVCQKLWVFGEKVWHLEGSLACLDTCKVKICEKFDLLPEKSTLLSSPVTEYFL